MDKQNEIFEEAARHCLKKLNNIDFLKNSELLGAEVKDNSLVISLYGQFHYVSIEGVKTQDGKSTNPAVSVLLLRYVLNCPDEIPPEGEWVTYREFEGAGVLSGHFTENTNKIIETSFSEKTDRLHHSAIHMGGIPFDDGSSFDVAIEFEALPRIPVLLRFNDLDGLLPAQCSILFRKSAECFLDLKSLEVVGTLLAGKLILNS
ncbi:MAG: DUF3786 domain-containing protein [Deltaproteobacteria bacterium]|nr:DUF3786 domain-containing protein [Deltaproteobacteria bacterium]MBW2179050.1 DUF3786 domain-containing protein [Deltaproteobacteria bacterium]MBW2363577.1 DUF3786 domain-containing protein [Deltaproteobacteria bacterium]